MSTPDDWTPPSMLRMLLLVYSQPTRAGEMRRVERDYLEGRGWIKLVPSVLDIVTERAEIAVTDAGIALVEAICRLPWQFADGPEKASDARGWNELQIRRAITRMWQELPGDATFDGEMLAEATLKKLRTQPRLATVVDEGPAPGEFRWLGEGESMPPAGVPRRTQERETLEDEFDRLLIILGLSNERRAALTEALLHAVYRMVK